VIAAVLQTDQLTKKSLIHSGTTNGWNIYRTLPVSPVKRARSQLAGGIDYYENENSARSKVAGKVRIDFVIDAIHRNPSITIYFPSFGFTRERAEPVPTAYGSYSGGRLTA
jgi:hypothetical protein